MTELFKLIDRAQRLGAEEKVPPIEALQLAQDIAEHADASADFDDIVELVDYPKNYYARWIGVRAISVMGAKAIRHVETLLRRRLDVEDFDLAKRELRNALAKLDEA